MSLLSKIFGYRWSLYICKDGQAMYEMHENSVIRIVGYVMGYFANGKTPITPWTLHLNFEKTHKGITLASEHFTEDGKNITPRLISDIEAIDSGYRVKGAEPIFFEVSTKKKLIITERTDYSNMQTLIDNAGKPKEPTFYRIMDSVFGK